MDRRRGLVMPPSVGFSAGYGLSGNIPFWAIFTTASGAIPNLVLDFSGATGGRYMAKGISKSFTDLVTFARASTAYQVNSSGVLESVASGAQRLTHRVADSTPRGIMGEMARTNQYLHSSDWTDVVYGTVTTMTVAKDQTGPDGVANSASSLLATGANSIVRQSVTVASAQFVYSVWMKRITGTGDINISQDGGVTDVEVSGDINTSTYVQVATLKQTQANPDSGVEIVTDTDKVAVWVGQLEEIEVVDKTPFASSPIPTTTIAVTRATETATFAVADFDLDINEGEWLVGFSEDNRHPTGFHVAFAEVGSERVGAGSNTQRVEVNTGANMTSNSITGQLPDGANHVYSFGYSAVGGWTVVLDDTANKDAAGADPTLPVAQTVFTILHRGGGVNNHSHANLNFVVYFTEKLSDADRTNLTVRAF